MLFKLFSFVWVFFFPVRLFPVLRNGRGGGAGLKVVLLVINTELTDYISPSLNLYILNMPLCHRPF